MQIKDEKASLRAKYKKMRSAVTVKAEKGAAAVRNLISSDLYAAAEQIFCYYPVKDEVDTLGIIEKALSDKKKTALPVCTNRNGNMEFYYIESPKALKKGAFGIPEPDAGVCRRACNYFNSLIIVPALSFDVCGFRLGYGGGYYDKFLKKFINSTSYSVGLCYNELVSAALPYEAHDVRVDYICTENLFFKSESHM